MPTMITRERTMRKTLKLSKAVRSGDLVAKRGDTYIRCGARMRPVGVYYQSGYSVRILTGDGRHATIDVPGGIIYDGPAQVKYGSVVP